MFHSTREIKEKPRPIIKKQKTLKQEQSEIKLDWIGKKGVRNPTSENNTVVKTIRRIHC